MLRCLAIAFAIPIFLTTSTLAELVPAAEPEPAGAIRISFVPPDLEGRYVLGIFNADGFLVRTLAENIYEADFALGRDGLVTTWDGLNDRGETCAPGKYSARGMVIGNLQVEGEAYYFNDWVAQDGVRVLEIAGTESLPDGGFGVRVRLADGSLRAVEISDKGELNWAKPVPTDSLESDSPQSTEDPLIIAMAPGSNNTTWRIIRESDSKNAPVRVVQTDSEGLPIRELKNSTGDMQPTAIRVSSGDDAILLLESKGGESRVRVLKRSSEAEASADPDSDSTSSDWEIIFERGLTAIRDFGFDGDQVVSAGGSGESELEVTLAPNSLANEPQTLKMIARSLRDGTSLVLENGLRIAKVGDGPDWQNIYLAEGDQPGTARLIQGDGIVVEEYALTGLDQIAPFDAGEFEIGTDVSAEPDLTDDEEE